MTLCELEKLVGEAIDPRDIFGDDLEGTLKKLRAIGHPDRHPGQERRAEAVLDALDRFARFTPEDVAAIARAEAVFRSLSRPDAAEQGYLPTIRSSSRVYALVEQLAKGDLADIYRARGEGRDFVLKVSRIREGALLLEAEREALVAILKKAGDTHYRKYFPALAESFSLRDGFPRQVNVFHHEPGLSTLEQVHQYHPALDGRHLAWIFKRLLTAVGFAHRCGRIHGAVVPAHALVHAEDHSLRLVGWGHSVEKGQRITTGPAQYVDWYPAEVRRKETAGPATDIFMAAKCLVHLAGGDPTSDRLPESLPPPFRAFLRSCLLEGSRMRPDDAWSLLDEFNDLLHNLYGPPRYHHLAMP